MAELSHGQAADGVAPVGDELGKRVEHEAALAKGRVGDEQALPGPGAAGPEQDVEIEHPGPPAPPRAPPEVSFDALEPGEKLVWGQTRREDQHRIGEAAAGRS